MVQIFIGSTRSNQNRLLYVAQDLSRLIKLRYFFDDPSLVLDQPHESLQMQSSDASILNKAIMHAMLILPFKLGKLVVAVSPFLATDVAKLIATSTCHMVAPLTLLDVVFALRALLILAIFCKLQHLIINPEVHLVDGLLWVSINLHRFGFPENSLEPIAFSNLHVYFLIQSLALFASVIWVSFLAAF